MKIHCTVKFGNNNVIIIYLLTIYSFEKLDCSLSLARSAHCSRIVFFIRIKFDFLRGHRAYSSSLGAEVLEATSDGGLFLSGCEGGLGSCEFNEVNSCLLRWPSPLRATLILVEVGTIIKDASLYFLFGLFLFSWRGLSSTTWLGTANQRRQRILKIIIFFLSDGSQAAAAHHRRRRLSRWIEWLYFISTSLTSLILLALFLFILGLPDVLSEHWQTCCRLRRFSWHCNFLSLLLLFLSLFLSHFKCIQFLF